MKTLVCTKPGTLDYSIGEMPELQANTALIKIKRIGVCGTDLHAFEGPQLLRLSYRRKRSDPTENATNETLSAPKYPACQ